MSRHPNRRQDDHSSRLGASATTLCTDTYPLEDGPPLRCDRGAGHIGRHAERWVASWSRGGTDLRWCSNDPLRDLYPVYLSKVP